MNKRNMIRALVFAFVMVLAIGAVLTLTRTTLLHNDSAIEITVQIERGTTWSFGSKQKVIWSITGLSSRNNNIVIYLENRDNGEKGFISSQPVKDGTGEANYVVNSYRDKNGEAMPLRNGVYDLTAAIYKTQEADQYDYGYGLRNDLTIERDCGEITIEDSDVDP